MRKRGCASKKRNFDACPIQLHHKKHIHKVSNPQPHTPNSKRNAPDRDQRLRQPPQTAQTPVDAPAACRSAPDARQRRVRSRDRGPACRRRQRLCVFCVRTAVVRKDYITKIVRENVPECIDNAFGARQRLRARVALKRIDRVENRHMRCAQRNTIGSDSVCGERSVNERDRDSAEVSETSAQRTESGENKERAKREEKREGKNFAGR